jgi:hypothetical protein
MRSALMRHIAFAGYLLVALGAVSLGVAQATCGEECDASYSSDIDDCRLEYGDDPADAQQLADCIQEARGNYRSYPDDCANAALPIRRWHSLVGYVLSNQLRLSAHCSRSVR